MSLFKTEYRIQWWQYHHNLDDIFEPEDVMPYYDMYEDGRIVLYIKIRKKSWKWLLFSVIEEKIERVHEEKIKITITETPERKTCGD